MNEANEQRPKAIESNAPGETPTPERAPLEAPEEIEAATGMPVPTPETAQRILRDLVWGEQLDCTETNPAVGNGVIRFYSLSEAARFLARGVGRLGHMEGGRLSGGGPSAWTKPEQLVAWVRRSLADESLAAALERDVPTAGTRREVMCASARLLTLRRRQAQGVLDREA